jgi:hypothetical protein
MSKEKPTKPQPVKAAPQPQPAKVKPKEDIYPVGEIIENATAIFTQPPDIVSAALTHAGITETSIDQARKVVKAFAERKV